MNGSIGASRMGLEITLLVNQQNTLLRASGERRRGCGSDSEGVARSRPFFGQFVPGERDISQAKSETGSERASQRGFRGRRAGWSSSL